MTNQPGFSARLKRLPGQLLLALVNATALLVIAACVLVIVMLNRVDQASGRIAETVTEAVLSKLEMTPAGLKARLDTLGARIDDLSQQLQTAGDRQDLALTRELEALNRNLGELTSAAQGIGSVGPGVTEAAFRQAGTTLTETLLALRGCAPVNSNTGTGS